MEFGLNIIGSTIVELEINTSTVKIIETITHQNNDYVCESIIDNLESIVLELKEYNNNVKNKTDNKIQ